MPVLSQVACVSANCLLYLETFFSLTHLIRSIVPEYLQRSHDSSDEGERLQLMIYRSDISLSEELEYEAHPLVSILNFQRQFAACTVTDEISTFDGKLLGHSSHSELKDSNGMESEIGLDHKVSDFETDSDSDSEDEDEYTISGNNKLMQTEAEFFAGKLAIPCLNASQEIAAETFLSGNDLITIVQG